jgi:hypothetical protein
MANPAAQMLKNFGKLVCVSLLFYFHYFKQIVRLYTVASKVCMLFWQFFSFARLKIPATVKACA